MKLFVGLGNPGRDYAKQRHNVGFMAVERIAEEHNFAPWKTRFQGEVSDGRLSGARVLLLKPQTYMNDSGRSVSAAARYLKIAPEDIVVFYDEIDLAPGKLKVKTGGGNAGHNGLRSITQHFDNNYQRVRIGVGRPQNKAQVSNHVLSNFSKVDLEWLTPLLDEMASAAPLLATDKGDQFLSTVVRAVTPAPAKSKPPSATPSQDRAKPIKASKPASGDTATEDAGSSLVEGLKSWVRKASGADSD